MNHQQILQSLLPMRDADNGDACMYCMQPNEHLVSCGACKRVSYCNKQCQTRDWPKHKAVCKLMKAFQAAATEMPNKDSPGGSKMHLLNKFLDFRQRVECGLVDQSSLKLPRDISVTTWKMAENLVVRSPCCSICKKNDYDFNNTKTNWKCCSRCNFGWCCKDHFKEYKPRHTKELCNKYIETSKIDRFRYNHVVNHGDFFMLVPEQPLSAPMDEFPLNWDEYFKLRTPEEYYYSKRNCLPPEFLPAGTFLLSQPVACLYAMYQHDREFFISAEELTIHVVGANSTFECEGGAPTCVWEETMHCLPSVKTMNVVFIGPELNTTQSFFKQIQCCPDCVAKGRVRKQGFYKQTYHDYYASDKFMHPDLVVAFNTGMFEECTDSWKQSLDIMLTLDVPCMFTSYDKNEGDSDFNVLMELNARTLTDSTVLNPFRVSFSWIDDTCIDKFFHANMYYVCFRGRKHG